MLALQPSSKVSIILPVFNAEKFLQKSIQSILSQSYVNIELIIINDGSTDSSADIINKFNDERIVHLQNKKNLGLISSLNIGFSKASGEFIARMDADDISHPLRIEKQVNFLKYIKKPALVGTNIIIINSNNEIIKIPRIMQSKCNENHWLKYRKCPVHHPTIMMNREIYDTLGDLYKVEDKHIEDYAAWFRINEKFPIYNLQERLLFYRVHESNISLIYNKFQIDSIAKLLTSYYYKLQGKKHTAQIAQSLLLLEKSRDLDLGKLFEGATLIYQDYRRSNPDNNFAKNDLAYSIINIGLKSSLKDAIFSLSFTYINFGIPALFYTAKLLLVEAINAFLLFYYFKIKFSSILKE